MKVCVDPGHGMSNATSGVFDPGAEHDDSGTREADVVLRYGLELKSILEARGFTVFMTRSDATTPTPVGARASRAKAAGCDVLVSIHLNSDDNPAAHGVEALYNDDSDEELAIDMRDALVTATALRKREVVKRPNLAVLKFEGPAVLLEVGFVSNDTDRTTVLKPEVQTKVCNAVADVLKALE
jgi:N-acetylmuramoyl-L-alanine amidase